MPDSISIVGIGGTTAARSTTEQAVSVALAAARGAGAETKLFGGPFLASLPHYSAGAVDRSPEAQQLIAAIRSAHGIVLGSPGYHGSISGLVKNAIDYIEETARDGRVYLDGVPVGLIVTAYGWQATGSTLAAMRSIVHALRGWPTPLGAAVRSTPQLFVDEQCCDDAVRGQLELVGRQVVEFARMRAFAPDTLRTAAPEENT